ncbi:MAG: GNAT family N-acetyltransferase [Pseudomonadota bacterium]
MRFEAEIYTERLGLRPVRWSDFRFVFRLLGNTSVRRCLGGAMAWRLRLSRFKKYLTAPHHIGLWLVYLTKTNQPIGLVMLGPHADGTDYEISYQFDPAYWGKGLASEAISTVIEHALQGNGFKRVIAETQSANLASCNLLRKQGMREICRIQRFGDEQIIFATL